MNNSNLNLRDYQQAAVNAAWEWMRKSKDPGVLELATGAGKSYILAELAHKIHFASNKRVLVLAPSAEIVQQNRDKFLLTGTPCSMFSASAGAKSLKHPIIFGSPLSVINKIKAFYNNFAAVFIDECHKSPPTINKIVAAIKAYNENLRVIGVTATPYRMDTGYIYKYDIDDNQLSEDQAKDPYFNKLLYSTKAEELIEKSYLAPLACASTVAPGYEVEKLTLNARCKFDTKEVVKVFENKTTKTNKIITEIVAFMNDSNRVCAMLFAATIRHAQEIMQMLDAANESSAALVTSDTSARDAIIEKAKLGKIKYLVSVGTLTTGADIPCVDVIVLLRHTASPGLLQQICGRGLRQCKKTNKQNCVLFDYAKNIERHYPDGNIYAPEVKANIRKRETQEIKARCEQCGVTNKFKARHNVEKLDIDEFGYFLDLAGSRLQLDGINYPAHYGRRCYGQTIKNGDSDRCTYRWSGKTCPACDHYNDIAARYCEKCKHQLVDPNDKLTVKAALLAQSEHVAKVARWTYKHYISKTGNSTLQVVFYTASSAIPVYYVERFKTQWLKLCAAIFGRAARWSTLLNKIETAAPPEYITYTKNSGGYYSICKYKA